MAASLPHKIKKTTEQIIKLIEIPDSIEDYLTNLLLILQRKRPAYLASCKKTDTERLQFLVHDLGLKSYVFKCHDETGNCLILIYNNLLDKYALKEELEDSTSTSTSTGMPHGFLANALGYMCGAAAMSVPAADRLTITFYTVNSLTGQKKYLFSYYCTRSQYLSDKDLIAAKTAEYNKHLGLGPEIKIICEKK